MAKDKKQAKDESSEQAPKKKGKKKLILLVLLGLLLLGGGFAAQQFFFGGSLLSSDSGEKGGRNASQASSSDEASTEMVSLPKLLVNLADPLGKRYLKMSVNLEVRGQKAANRIKKRMPRVKDSLILLLSSKTYDDLSSMQDKLTLKSQIAQRLNQIMEESLVKRVYFTEFIIQ